jgi:mono/diheme cytochrome c family protein
MKPKVVAVHLCVWVLLSTTASRQALPQSAPDTPSQSRPSSVASDAGRAAFMQHHFGLVTAVHDALIAGDLQLVRQHASQLENAADPTGLPASAGPYVTVMHRAAGRAAAADDLEDAASATSAMLAACGDCHRAVGTMPALPTPSPPAMGGVVGHMLQHSRAMDSLAQGLIVPSTSAWQVGATALESAPLRKRELPRDAKLTREILETEQWIHDLAGRAKESTETRSRIYVYSELLESCATCHALHGKVWGPSVR